MTTEGIERPNKGGRPRKDVTKTAEFKQAVESAVTEVVSRLAQIRAETASGPASEGENDMIGRLALSIGEIANQTSGRKIVAPDELASRARSRSRMLDLLQRIHEQRLVPEYALTSETYLNDTLVKPFENDATGAIVQVEIEWDGIPNEAMRPLNAVAEELYDAFLGSIGGFTDATKNTRNDPYWVTKNGLTIKGRGGSRRTVGSLGDSNIAAAADTPASPTFSSRFSKKGDPHDPRATSVSVLGTIAPQARQNGQGTQARQ